MIKDIIKELQSSIYKLSLYELNNSLKWYILK